MTEIISTPGVLGGKPRLKGYRISVLDVIELLDSGYTYKEVSEQLDITKEEVKTADNYRQENQSEIKELKKERREKHKKLQGESKVISS